MLVAVALARVSQAREQPWAAGLRADPLLARAPLLHPVGDRRVAEVLPEELDPSLLDRGVNLECGAQFARLQSFGQLLATEHRIDAILRVEGELARIEEPGLPAH